MIKSRIELKYCKVKHKRKTKTDTNYTILIDTDFRYKTQIQFLTELRIELANKYLK